MRKAATAHPTVHLHFTPTHSSWLNQVELWFGKIERDAIARGVFTSVSDLKRKLMRYIRQYNKSPRTSIRSYRSTRGFLVFKSPNREKSLSALRSSRTPWWTQRAAILPSCTRGPVIFEFPISRARTSQYPAVSESSTTRGDSSHALTCSRALAVVVGGE
jgi:hypothetical protein